MILAALMLVLGSWGVQQLASLPSLAGIGLLAIAISLLLISHFPHRVSKFIQQALWLGHLRTGLLAFLIGVCWASGMAHWRLSDALPAQWQQKTIEIVGVVTSVPEITERGTRFRFDVEKVLTPHAIVPRHVSLNHYQEFFTQPKAVNQSGNVQPNFHAGERWQLSVRLKRPHGTVNPHGFDFEAWALAENIRATGSIKNKGHQLRLNALVYQPKYLLERLREGVREHIGKTLKSRPYSGVIQALVMGDDSRITQADWQVFLRTGTTHLMSISGLHITMLSGLAFGLVGFLWRRIPVFVMYLPTRKAATLAGVSVAMLYALIVGFSIPTQRTLYMLLVFALVLWSGRQVAISQVLAMALMIVVILDPWAVISAGFWLSFGAVAMLAYALSARIGQEYWLRIAIKTQWVVTIGMLPLLLMMFNQVSIISPIANALAIPLISFVVTPLALLGSFLHIDTLTVFAHEILSAGMWALQWLNQLPAATWQQQAPPSWALVPAMLGVLWVLLPRGWPLRWFGLLGFLPMFLIAPMRPVMSDMQVTVLDVGQGLSVVVQTSTHALLYDAGPQYSAQHDAGSRIIVPFLRGEGIQKLDALLVSHDDNDHSGGMQSVLTNVPVDWLLTSFDSQMPPAIKLTEKRCIAGHRWQWDGVWFEVLHPALESYSDEMLKDNDRSCVLKMTSHAGSLLLTGDIEKTAESQLLATYPEALKSDVLVVPHHGSKTSSTPDFIAAVQPQVSLFTMGYLNRFGHPKPLIVSRHQALGSRIYRSDQHGAVQLQFNAQAGQIKISDWRGRQRRYWQDTYLN